MCRPWSFVRPCTFYPCCTHTVTVSQHYESGARVRRAPRSPRPTTCPWTRVPCVSAYIAASYAEQYGATLACCTVDDCRMLRTLYTPL
ncbi:hypothetical protein EXIGLDRAFT_394102 [Exidia glandulosa HHB12029]|uniref:Uncharacterized protein n=1 Tax=Exidia glandulosa HHB12029 TaxID=1314781 RepID=A0A165KY73_EXIGL|nr:hypothetical protein EXIGLDRAFT_394102 [Exidia glandulosa HHB12029]